VSKKCGLYTRKYVISYITLVGRPERRFEELKHIWEDNSKIDLGEIRCGLGLSDCGHGLVTALMKRERASEFHRNPEFHEEKRDS
jgi:hypothetical protein